VKNGPSLGISENKQAFSFRGFALWPPTKGSVPGLRWGARPRYPSIPPALNLLLRHWCYLHMKLLIEVFGNCFRKTNIFNIYSTKIGPNLHILLKLPEQYCALPVIYVYYAVIDNVSEAWFLLCRMVFAVAVWFSLSFYFLLKLFVYGENMAGWWVFCLLKGLLVSKRIWLWWHDVKRLLGHLAK